MDVASFSGIMHPATKKKRSNKVRGVEFFKSQCIGLSIGCDSKTSLRHWVLYFATYRTQNVCRWHIGARQHRIASGV